MPDTIETVANDTSNAANAAAATAHLANGAGETTPDSPTINIVDLQNAVKVIDFAADQGAFKGWQVIKQVMSVRDKLDEFVLAASPAAPAALEPEPEAKPKKRGKK